MQGNSKYLRWSPLYTCCCVFVILSSTVIAVPVRQRRMVEEDYLDAVATNTISNATCFQDGTEVPKSSVKCEIKTGCKFIQKTGECCPDYQCDCNHEDRIYKNNEKIVSHNPCRRCVCKGGEVTCNDVSCYIRDDCKPRYVKGVCCPQFDNCPPIDDVKIPVTKETDTKWSKNDVIVSKGQTTSANDMPKDDMQFANENPLGITIKEITKPEEIRITDDKPKPYNPFKTTTTTTTTTTSVPSTTATESSSESTTKSVTDSPTTTTNDITTASQKESKELSTEDTNPPEILSEHESREFMEDTFNDSSSSTAPPTKASAEGEVEPKELLASADSNSITDDAGNKSVRQTVEHSTTGDVDQLSEVIYLSSTTEFSTESSSTPTASSESGEASDLVELSTPKNLVVVQHGGKTESFHISGTDGLQRVEEPDVVSSTTETSSEDSSETVTQSSEQSVIVSTDNMVGKASEEMILLESSSTTGLPETFDESSTVGLPPMEKSADQTSNLNDSSTENTSNSSIESSTPDDGFSESSSELVGVSEKAYDTVYYGEMSSTASPFSGESFETMYYGPTEDFTDSSSTTEGPDTAFSSTDSSVSTEQSSVSVSTTESSSTTKGPSTESPESSCSRISFEEEEATLAENPEYPYIPDDLSIHNKDIIEEEDKRRIPSKVLDEPFSSTVGPCDECDIAKSNEVSTTQGAPDDAIKMSHKDDMIESRAPGEPHLIPEWERSTTLGPDATTSVEVMNNTSTSMESVANVNKSAALTSKHSRTMSILTKNTA